MAKKKLDEVDEIIASIVDQEELDYHIDEITTDFGRADLNELAAKLNEVIKAING